MLKEASRLGFRSWKNDFVSEIWFLFVINETVLIVLL